MPQLPEPVDGGVEAHGDPLAGEYYPVLSDAHCGTPFARLQIVAIDGYPVPEGSRVLQDTVNVAPGQRYDVI